MSIIRGRPGLCFGSLAFTDLEAGFASVRGLVRSAGCLSTTGCLDAGLLGFRLFLPAPPRGVAVVVSSV